MTIEERLNEIVEKGQGDAIIPFLQGLTQEERKTLVPCLNKLEEHYNKFVQLNENTYGTRGTPEQHRIINLTALVIYSLKEFRKHEWGIYTEQLNELIPWYIPSCIDSFIKRTALFLFQILRRTRSTRSYACIKRISACRQPESEQKPK